MSRVLVVDDEPKITEVVASYLARAGHEPVTAASGAEALRLFEECAPALVILDLMLPDTSGEDVCRRLRARSRVPVIMLTARAGDADVVAGLGLGADDYVTKPFSPRQLVARVEAVLRRSEARPLARTLSFGGGALSLDGETGEVKVRGAAVALTARELRLLRLLAAHPGRVFSREELIERVMGDEFSGIDRTVDAHVKNLRRKIEADPARPRWILTVHGTGYRFTGDAAP